MTAQTITLIPQTDQEAFDIVVAHLRQLPHRAWEGSGQDALTLIEDDVCVYRGDRDPTSPIRCAIGRLIPDDQYSPDMEGKGVHAFWSLEEKWGFKLITTINHALLGALQNAHDDAENWDEHGFNNEDALVDIALRFHLVYSP